MAFNVRYTAMAFPAFVVVLAAAVEVGRRSPRILPLVGVGLLLWGGAMWNHYTNPRYAKEDIRGVVHYWRELDDEEILLSYNCAHTINRYLTPLEEERHFPIWLRSETSTRIRQVFDRSGAREVYVVAARERLAVETFVHRDFRVLEDMEFSGGVRLMRIALPAVRPEDGESDDHTGPDGPLPQGS
jgi:hypothetical protein